jgi:hypothetical protein
LISAGGFQAKFGDKLSSVLNTHLSKTYSIWRKPRRVSLGGSLAFMRFLKIKWSAVTESDTVITVFSK